MSTVAQLIDRVYRNWLYPPDEQPVRFTLGAAITSTSATTFTVDTDFLSPEEAELFAAGTVVEVDSELMQVGAYDEDAASDQASSVKRGVLGTTAATHLIGAYGTVSPKYPRQSVFDAVCDGVEALYPDLFQVVASASLSFSATAYTEVPATVMEPLYIWGRPSGASLYSEVEVELADHAPWSSTGKAIHAPGFAEGGTGYLVYQAAFARPASESVDLVATTGLAQGWERILVVGAAADLIAGKDLSPVEQRYLSEQLAGQGFPVHSAGRIRDGLLRYQEYLIGRAKKSLRTRYDTPVSTNWPI